MNKIADAFHNKKAFIAYLMAGDPNLDKTADFILALQDAGADLIEIGIPFSDPIAEGEVIQAASVRALQAGTRLDGVFEMVASLQGQVHIPLVFMTYLNPVFVYGYDRFFSTCAKIGICGIIIPDLPYEEQGEAKEIARRHGIEVVTLLAPTSEARTDAIAREAEGFLYLVSSMGVTGVRSEITTDVGAMVQRVRAATSLPVAVGFGIATPEQAETYARMADGVIVGSAIVGRIAEYGDKAAPVIAAYVREMKQAVQRASGT